MRITSKGQVTIPQEIREKLGMLPYTEVAFEVRGDVVIVRRTSGEDRGRRIVDHLKRAGAGRLRMTTDEIMALTRGEPDEFDARGRQRPARRHR